MPAAKQDKGVQTGDVAALVAPGVDAEAPAPTGPSFGMSEGTREELERTGHAVDPFTGKALTSEDLSK
jgi:hypothetical protein